MPHNQPSTDWSLFELPSTVNLELDTLPQTKATQNAKKRCHQGREFFAGPIDMEWLCKAAMLNGASLQVALMLFHLRKLRRLDWVPLSNLAMEQMGVSPDAKTRAIAALENADLIEVKRQAGKSPMIKVLDIS